MGFFPPARPVIGIECWVWYALVILVVVLRFVSQQIIHGKNIFRKGRRDDLIMVFATCTYTIGITCLYIYDGIQNSLDFDALTPEDAARYGRQLGIVNILAETSIQTTLFSVKANLLVLDYRLTRNAKFQYVVIAVSIYTALSYVGIMIMLYAGWCRPFSQYLVFDPEVEQCLSWVHYNTVHLVLNVSSDLMIFAIPLYIVSKSQVELKRKFLVIGIFALGLFVIIAAVCQKVAVFLEPLEPVWLLWSIREISTAMLVGNLVFCQPLIRRFSNYITMATTSSSWDLRPRRSKEPTGQSINFTEKEEGKQNEKCSDKRFSSTTTAADSV